MARREHFRKEEVYSNGLIIGQNGRPVCTLNGKRLDWYLKRGLAEEIAPPTGYPRAIRLNFQPKYNREPQPYELAIIKNECCLCGAKEKLTIHHVIPKVIRKLFPKSEKDRSRQWCLLLCLDCHRKVENVTQAVYKDGYPAGVLLTTETDQLILRRMKGMGILYKLSPTKYDTLMKSAGYSDPQDIPSPPNSTDELGIYQLRSKLHRKAIDAWALKFIEEHGGTEGTKAYFRELFLSFEPQYLPEGYLDL